MKSNAPNTCPSQLTSIEWRCQSKEKKKQEEENEEASHERGKYVGVGKCKRVEWESPRVTQRNRNESSRSKTITSTWLMAIHSSPSHDPTRHFQEHFSQWTLWRQYFTTAFKVETRTFCQSGMLLRTNGTPIRLGPWTRRIPGLKKRWFETLTAPIKYEVNRVPGWVSLALDPRYYSLSTRSLVVLADDVLSVGVKSSSVHPHVIIWCPLLILMASIHHLGGSSSLSFRIEVLLSSSIQGSPPPRTTVCFPRVPWSNEERTRKKEEKHRPTRTEKWSCSWRVKADIYHY